MTASLLPVWVQYLQALAVPALAVVGAWIALQQMHIARVKLQHDLYDRRFKIYDTAKTLLLAHQRNGTLSADDYIAYRRGIADAVFLLDAGTVKYLGNLQSNAEQLLRLSNHPTENADELARIENWLQSQFETLTSTFKPCLKLNQNRWSSWFKD